MITQKQTAADSSENQCLSTVLGKDEKFENNVLIFHNDLDIMVVNE